MTFDGLIKEMKKENIKVALISLQKDAERTPPMGLVYLATYLSEEMKLTKSNIKIFDNNYHDIEKEVDNFSPDVIGITAMSIDYNKAILFATKCKEKNNTSIIIGGVHISTIPKSFKECFDVGVIGEGEKTLQELIKVFIEEESFSKNKLKSIDGIIYLDNNKLIETGTKEPIELDSLPLPDFSFIHKDYFKEQEVPGVKSFAITGNLISSRGCPYRCEFCSTARFWGKMRLHSPKYTARVAEKLVNEYNVNYIGILDDLFTITPQRIKEIRKEFEKIGILDKIDWIGCMVRANLMTDELCKEMKELKIKIINFGFESGSDRVLKYLKVESVSVEMNKNAILLGKKYGFNIYGSLMYGSPGEKIEDMEKTNEFIDFCIENGVDNVWSFVATPFPSTPFWEEALKMETVSQDMDFSLLNHHISQRPLLLDSDISLEDFQKVFFEGKNKLRKLRIKLLLSFVLNNKLNTIKTVVKNPEYYFSRMTKQLLKQ